MARPIALAALVAVLLTAPSGVSAAALTLLPPGNGDVRALVVGIDKYQHVNPLRGAVADARDIQAALIEVGSKDVVTLIDGEADRARLLAEFDRLVTRTRAGDLVIVTLAGHGAKEDERVKGSSGDGSDEVFLLPDFDPKTGPSGAEKILNHEFHHYLKLIEARGAQVIFVADTCYGGGLAREVTLGAPAITYRQVPRYRLAEDDLKPVSTPDEAFLTALDFERTTFLAAVDSKTKAPEVLIDSAYRGALSYAFARALQGAADENRDRKVTLRQFFAYTRKVVYQLSDERQNIVTSEPLHRDVDTDVVLQWGDRGVGRPAHASAPTPVAAALNRIVKPLRVASASVNDGGLAALKPLQTPFEIVDLDAAPDLVWDPVSREAIAGGDKIALSVELDDLPGVVDRTAAIRDLKSLVVMAPQAVRVLPDASLHRKGSRIDVDVGELAGRHLVLLDITGSGEVQLLYPTRPHMTPPPSGSVRVPFLVRDPFGADQVLAITSAMPMDTLVTALGGFDKRRSAGRLFDVVRRNMPPDARLGLVGLFTVP